MLGYKDESDHHHCSDTRKQPEIIQEKLVSLFQAKRVDVICPYSFFFFFFIK